MKRRGVGTDRSAIDPPQRRYRFFLADPPDSGDVLVRGDVAHRIARVLRLPPGSKVHLFDGSGRSWPATVIAIVGQGVRLAVGAAEQHGQDSVTILLAGMIRPNRFEWLIEKTTELGVTTLLPVICERSAVRPAEIGASRLERWRRIAVEAAEQSGRVTIPTIVPPATVGAALDASIGRLLVATEPAHGTVAPLGSVLDRIGDGSATLFIGPEGGLTRSEVGQATAVGAQSVSLGPLILRAETAAIAALSILVDARQRTADGHAG